MMVIIFVVGIGESGGWAVGERRGGEGFEEGW